jgi:DNA-binding NtrC family response regulator
METGNGVGPSVYSSSNAAAGAHDGNAARHTMTYVMLVGSDVALLEGLSQSLARQGMRLVVSTSLDEAREHATAHPPLIIVAQRDMASESGAELLALPVAGGGARILYRAASVAPAPLLPALQRAVLADLTLPLERQRLAALCQSVCDRARTTGRAPRDTPPDMRAV